MKLTKKAKELIDRWFDNKTPEEVDYIISKYTPNKQLPIVVESNFICAKQNKGEIKCKTQCGWCEGNN